MAKKKEQKLPPPTFGREEQAIRWAANRFEKWNNTTGFVQEHTNYYYEILGIIEDATKYGFGVAHGRGKQEIEKHINDNPMKGKSNG